MKKIIAIALIAVMVLGLCACSVNDTEVSILWSGANDHAVVPNSLINAMDRAMYIENLTYKHYAANGDQAAQTKQAETCLSAGCSALMVELVDPSAAQTIVDMAKAKNVPVVFFGCEVAEAVVKSYDKCVAITTDEASLADVYADMVSAYVIANVKLTEEGKDPAEDDMDLNNDGKITYMVIGDVQFNVSSVVLNEGKKNEAAVALEKASVKLEDLTLKIETKEKKGLFGTSTEEYARMTAADGTVVEMILMNDDNQTLQTLVALQELGLNTNKLATHFMPVFTVGADADYKAYVMKDMPAEAEARKAHLEAWIQLVDMTTLSAEEWEKRANGEKNEVDNMIYNTINQVGAGKLCGTAMENYDAIAIAAAEAAANLIQGVSITEQVIKLSYTVTG